MVIWSECDFWIFFWDMMAMGMRWDFYVHPNQDGMGFAKMWDVPREFYGHEQIGEKKEYWFFFWWFKLPVDGIGSPSFRPISFPAWHFAIAPPGSERGNFLPEMMVWSHFSTESQFCSIGVDNFDILYHNLFKICWNGTEWNVSIMILIDHSPDTNISRWNLNPQGNAHGTNVYYGKNPWLPGEGRPKVFRHVPRWRSTRSNASKDTNKIAHLELGGIRTSNKSDIKPWSIKDRVQLEIVSSSALKWHSLMDKTSSLTSTGCIWIQGWY